MSQLNVYVPDDLEKEIKKAAKKKGLSISAFIAETMKQKINPTQWSAEFLSMLENPIQDQSFQAPDELSVKNDDEVDFDE